MAVTQKSIHDSGQSAVQVILRTLRGQGTAEEEDFLITCNPHIVIAVALANAIPIGTNDARRAPVSDKANPAMPAAVGACTRCGRKIYTRGMIGQLCTAITSESGLARCTGIYMELPK